MPADIRDRSGENDVDLVEIWYILARRRYWIVAVVLVAIALASAFVLLKAPVFESRVKMEVGQVSADEERVAFESPEVIAARLLAHYGPIAPDGSTRLALTWRRPLCRRVQAP